MNPQTETKLIELLASIDLSLKELAKAAKERPAASSGAGQSAGWRVMKVPSWAKFDAGKQFGDLDDKGLFFWTSKWFPKPFTKTDGTIVPTKSTDAALRKALDEAAKELGLPLPDGYEPAEAPKQASEADPDAFVAPPRSNAKPAPPPRDNIDEDVPF